MENRSKALAAADDSAARLLRELLGDSPGRNFDIESIFLEKTTSGLWRWWIFEFLKCDSELRGIDVRSSHPNRYWEKNKRKFLSLWAVVKCLRKAGCEAELVLVNYDDGREFVKRMIVKEIDEYSEENWIHEGRAVYGKSNFIVTEDKVMTFEEFRNRFRNFNDTKSGDTWEILSDL